MPSIENVRHIEALVEDRSGAIILAGMLDKILAALARQPEGPRWTMSLRPHRGVGKLPIDPGVWPERYTANLLGLLPAKLRAYSKLPAENTPDLVLLVCDADEKDPRAFFNSLRYAARSTAPDLPLIIGLAVEELEAWMLGDRAALLAAYPEAAVELLDTYEQDSVCGSWELLARAIMAEEAEALIEMGYPAVGQYKSIWAQKIAPFLEPERNLSPSFKRFYKALEFALNRPAEPAHRMGAARRS